MTHLFRPNENTQMTFRIIIDEDGSNERLYQNKVYNFFVKYLREASSKYFVVIVVVFVVVQFSPSIPSKSIRKPLVS